MEHVGLGSDVDLDGRDVHAVRKYDLDGINYAKKIFDLTEGLVRRKYSSSDIELILGGNFERALAETWTPRNPYRYTRVSTKVFWVILAGLAILGVATAPLSLREQTRGTSIITPRRKSKRLNSASFSAGGAGRVDRIMLNQPLLDFFFLRCQHNALPAHLTRAFTIFSHNIRAFVEDLDQAIGLGALEVIRGRGSMMLLHMTPL